MQSFPLFLLLSVFGVLSLFADTNEMFCRSSKSDAEYKQISFEMLLGLNPEKVDARIEVEGIIQLSGDDFGLNYDGRLFGNLEDIKMIRYEKSVVLRLPDEMQTKLVAQKLAKKLQAKTVQICGRITYEEYLGRKRQAIFVERLKWSIGDQ